MFDKSTSHLGMFFKNLNELILLLNIHIGLKAQESLEMLYLLGLKITFLMKIKFNSIYYFFKCVFIFEFNLICKYTKLHDHKCNLLNTRDTYYIYIVGSQFRSIYLGSMHLHKHDRLTCVRIWIKMCFQTKFNKSKLSHIISFT